jgi:spore cortex formation protein SpoVR/YcgB (stage V sporulation)
MKENKLRIISKDQSFIDVYLSQTIKDKFGFHWETKNKANQIFRYDNVPDKSWKNVTTFPFHFHNSSEQNVEASPFPLKLPEGFRAFMNFVGNKLI